MSWTIDKQGLDQIRVGAGLLASGGGGAVWGKAEDGLIEEILEQDHPVVVVSPDELDEDQRGAVVAIIGSPDAIVKQGGIKAEAVASVWKILEKLTGSPPDGAGAAGFAYSIPVEIGSLSTLIPMLVGGKLGLPVVDGDGAGRAVPSLPLLTYATCKQGTGMPSYPLVMGNNQVAGQKPVRLEVSRVPGPDVVDDILRGVIGGESFQSLGPLALWAQSAADSKSPEVMIPGGITDCRKLGESLRAHAGADPETILSNCLETLEEGLGRKSYPLFIGRLKSVKEETTGGFDIVTVTLESQEGSLPGIRCTIRAQNESLIAWRSDLPEPIAMAPDSICYLALETKPAATDSDSEYGPGPGLPLSNADLEGKEDWQIALIGIEAKPQLRTRASLAAFQGVVASTGYGGIYVPIEELRR